MKLRTSHNISGLSKRAGRLYNNLAASFRKQKYSKIISRIESKADLPENIISSLLEESRLLKKIARRIRLLNSLALAEGHNDLALSQVPNSFFFGFELNQEPGRLHDDFDKFAFYIFVVAHIEMQDGGCCIGYHEYRRLLMQNFLNEIEVRRGRMQRNFSCSLGRFLSPSFVESRTPSYTPLCRSDRSRKVVYLADYTHRKIRIE